MTNDSCLIQFEADDLEVCFSWTYIYLCLYLYLQYPVSSLATDFRMYRMTTVNCHGIFYFLFCYSKHLINIILIIVIFKPLLLLLLLLLF
jgi:hypothetical protein